MASPGVVEARGLVQAPGLLPRDHVRAALIAVVLLVSGIAASPMPKSVRRAHFETPIAIEEVDRWVGILGGVGVTVTRKELADRTYTVGKFFADLRGTLLGPFKGWFRVTGTGQGWGLFTYPDSYPHQLVIEVRAAGSAPGSEDGWRPIYAALDPDAAWHRDQLAYRRVRGVYDGNTRKPGPSYDNFVAWASRQAFADLPDAAEVRIGFIRTHSTMPGVQPDPERLPKFQRVVARPVAP
ncbi:MAG: hypothetical protein Q8P41_22015 [Pseudomonadota bacterium]|nr:hypothetical protein [Pseudomonadota bacterium]